MKTHHVRQASIAALLALMASFGASAQAPAPQEKARENGFLSGTRAALSDAVEWMETALSFRPPGLQDPALPRPGQGESTGTEPWNGGTADHTVVRQDAVRALRSGDIERGEAHP